MIRSRVLVLSGLTLSLLIVISALTIAYGRLSNNSRASSNTGRFSSLFSANNSYIFASPISAEANGQSSIRITVFLLNSQGLGVGGQKVRLVSTPNLNFDKSEMITDAYGKAIFDSVSTTAGNYTIQAYASNEALKQQVVVSFHKS